MRRAAALLLAAALAAADAAAEPPTGEEVARRIETRPRPAQAHRLLRLTLVDGEGRERERLLRSVWKQQPDARWLAFFALAPPELEHTALLAHDHFDASRSDDQWIYLPARRRAQRIASPSRGDPFLGSDFSFEDMKKEDRVEVGEYRWRTLREERDGERTLWVVEQRPATEELARDLGYGHAVVWVDARTAMRRRIEFFDLEGAPLKTFEIEVEEVDGFATARRIEARSARGHRSILQVERIDFESPAGDEVFTIRTLEAERGARLEPRLHPAP